MVLISFHRDEDHVLITQTDSIDDNMTEGMEEIIEGNSGNSPSIIVIAVSDCHYQYIFKLFNVSVY